MFWRLLILPQNAWCWCSLGLKASFAMTRGGLTDYRTMQLLVTRYIKPSKVSTNGKPNISIYGEFGVGQIPFRPL